MEQRKTERQRGLYEGILAKGVLVTIFFLCFQVAYATNTEEEKQPEGTSTGNPLISVTKDIEVSKEIESKLMQDPQEKYQINVRELKEHKEGLLKQTQQLTKENTDLKNEVETLKSELAKQQALQAKQPEPGNQSQPVQIEGAITVTATAYTAYCTGCSGITAMGTDVRHKTPNIIAVDPRVIPLGSKVELFNNGVSMGIYLADDTGGAIKGNKIDILMTTSHQAKDWGVRKIQAKVLD